MRTSATLGATVHYAAICLRLAILLLAPHMPNTSNEQPLQHTTAIVGILTHLLIHLSLYPFSISSYLSLDHSSAKLIYREPM